MKKAFHIFSLCFAVFICAAVCGAFSEHSVTVEESAKADYGSCDEHIYLDDYTEVTPATCTSNGVKWRKCVVCGYIDRIETPKDPDVHSLVSNVWMFDPAPNCTEGGVKFHICYGCNKQVDVTEVPPDPEAHVKSGDYVTVTPANCAEKGEKAYLCALCGEYFGFEEIDVDSSVHITSENSKWEVIEEPACAKDGKMVCYCDNCGEIAVTKAIPATGKHTPSNELTVDVPPTCVSDGSASYHCTECGASVGVTVLPAEPDSHTFSEDFTVDKAATCSYEGQMSRHCIYCGAVTDITVIPADEKAHIYGDKWITDREPTCSVYGLKHKICTLCGEESNSTVIPQIPHTYGEYEVIEYSSDKLSAKVKYTCLVCGHEYYDIVIFSANGDNGNIGDNEKRIQPIIPADDTVIKVDNDNMYISNVAKKMTVEDFFGNFLNSSIFVIYDVNNRIIDESDIIASGYRVNYTDPDGNVTNYKVSVTGDVTSDGDITSADARKILRAAAGIEKIENEFFIAANVNGDKKITASDAREVLRVSAGLQRFDETLPPIPNM